MKKTVAILLSFGLFLMLQSCSKVKEPDEKIYTIGFSQCVDDMWRQIMMIQMEAEVTGYPDLRLIIKNASGNTEKQIEQIEELIADGVDLLIISPNESGPVTEVAVKAYRQGIPTMIWDRKIESSEYTTFIGADNYAIGRDVGEYIRSVLPKGSSILEICGLKGSSPAKDRHQGFLDEINGDYLLTTISGDWQPAVAKARVEDIADHGRFDLVFGHNDDMAIAAYEAIDERSHEEAERMRFIGIDAIVGVDAVIDGRLDASFLYPPGGEFVIETAWKILNEVPVDKNYTLKSSIVDISNAQTLKSQSEQILNYQNIINNQKKYLDRINSGYTVLRIAVIITTCFAAVMLFFLLFSYMTNRKLVKRNKDLELKRIETESKTDELIARNAEIENLSNQKLQFFTNLSHEIRTPLTLIINPLDKMSKMEKDPVIRDNIWTLQRNAKHLLKIVNQILDFRKIENNKMVLNVYETDIVAFTEEIVKYFETYAQTEKIVYKFTSDINCQKLWIDPDKMEQVLINLISNAFKNSKKYGVITVSITALDDEVTIEVHDTGRGMDINTQQHIFDRFYSVGNSKGIGIGLHLCKEYVEMHKGKLTVASEPGKYTSFFLTLKKGKEHLDSDVNFLAPRSLDDSASNNDDPTVAELLSKKYNQTLLIAEDDDDIREYLKSELSENFKVIAVSNGYDAIQMLQEEEIDLVLSDVLMPHISGFQLCRDIKRNVVTSHIPVILLTALVDDSQQIYGIAEGADEYIRKPFNVDFVRAKLIRIVEQKQATKDYFIQKLNKEKIFDMTTDDTTSSDDIFKNRLTTYLEENYKNSDINIDQMSQSLGMSRVQLYRKSKALFGLTPTDILRSYRLTKSAVMLKENNMTISEIAYDCGFAAPAYYTRCFKEKFGVSPTEFIRQNENDKENEKN